MVMDLTAVDAMMAVITTAVCGSSFCFYSAAETAADAAADSLEMETAVAANSGNLFFEGIFGCPPSKERTPTLIETLKLFLPYFPLHIQKLISMYLKILEMWSMMENLRNMMNHMEQYQEIFQMFQTAASGSEVPKENTSGFPDFSFLQKFMEGSELADEFTYMEGSPGTPDYGSPEDLSSN